MKTELEKLISEIRSLQKQNDNNADKVKPADLYYLGRASAFSDVVIMLEGLKNKIE